MTLSEIIRAGAAYTGDTLVAVDTAYSTVEIGDDVFMQGDDAVQFIDAAEALWNEAQDVSIAECWAHLASSYIGY